MSDRCPCCNTVLENGRCPMHSGCYNCAPVGKKPPADVEVKPRG